MLIDQFKNKNGKKLVIKPSWIKTFKSNEHVIKLNKSLSKVLSALKVENIKEITHET
jgi:hypothetical protein